jgi:ketosteroid isomerase-like protein
MLDLYAAWEQMDIEVEELIDAGDKVVAVIRVTGRGRVSGIEIEYSPAGVWTIRDGRIVRVVWFVARDDALEAAGVES